MDVFLHWWQHLPESISPFIIDLGSLKIRYYGVMYILAFLVTYHMALFRLKREQGFDITKEQLQSIMTMALLGLIIGGKLGYALFYDLSTFVRHPIEAVLPLSFDGGLRLTNISGMSYHGGLAGVVIGIAAGARKNGIGFFKMTDLLCPVIPLGYTLGRIGNFINGELFGRVTSSSMGMYFPLAADTNLRHPTQLYEALFEGIILFLALFGLRRRVQISGIIFALYLIGYGLVRFLIEFIREPDGHLGLVFHNLTMGQLLCSGMIISGAWFIYFQHKNYHKEAEDENWQKH